MAYTMELRIKALEMYEQESGVAQSEVAELLGISLSTFKRWLSRRRKGENLMPLVGDKGRPLKIDEHGLETIRKLIRENPAITLRELTEVYYKKHRVVVGTSIMFRALKKLDFSHKKVSIRASEKETDVVKKKGKII
jgi:transposase